MLGVWVGGNESAKYWLGVLTELKNRGVQDILICCIDGLMDFEQTIGMVFPQTEIQRCIVHQVRYSCIRKVARPKRIFPTNEFALKIVFLALQSRIKKWTMRVRNWNMIIGQLSIHFSERIEACL